MGSDSWKQWLSYVIPIRDVTEQGRFGQLELTWENGRRVVNSANANQSFGTLHAVWQQCLGTILPKGNSPERVLLCGLGAGSVVHILRNEVGIDAPIMAIEADPVMLRWGRTYFGMDNIHDLSVLEGDALESIHTIHMQADLIIVDLFNDLDVIDGAEDPLFLRALARSLAPHGTLAFNTIRHDTISTDRSVRIADGLRACGLHVDELHVEEKNVVLAARHREIANDGQGPAV